MPKSSPAWAVRTATLVGGVVVSMIVGSTIPAMASPIQDQADFIAHYERNAQMEATLLQKANESSATSPTISSLSATVDSLNQEIANLYTTEQAIANLAVNPPTVNVPDVGAASLVSQRQDLQVQVRQLVGQVRRDRKVRDSVQLQADQQQLSADRAQVQDLNRHIVQIRRMLLPGHRNGMVNALRDLQTSIGKLQETVIAYTNLWIAAESNVNAPSTSANSDSQSPPPHRSRKG